MRPQSCKSKGRRLQQKIAQDIRAAFPHLGEDDVVSTSMGANGEDVRLSTAARECVDASFECKNVEKINIWSCLQQCEANTPTGVTPCLIFSRNRCPTYAVVPWPHLLRLYKTRRGGSRLPARAVTLVKELMALVNEQGEGGEVDDVDDVDGVDDVDEGDDVDDGEGANVTGGEGTKT